MGTKKWPSMCSKIKILQLFYYSLQRCQSSGFNRNSGFFLVQISELLFIFSPFLTILSPFYALFQVFSSISGFFIDTDWHLWAYKHIVLSIIRENLRLIWCMGGTTRGFQIGGHRNRGRQQSKLRRNGLMSSNGWNTDNTKIISKSRQKFLQQISLK